MDLLGDIVEKDPYNDNIEIKENIISHNTVNGFPKLYKPKKISSWKQRLQDKNKEKKVNTQENKNVNISEAESIHMDNLKKMNDMTEQEILDEQKELLNSLNPKLIQNLLKNINQRSKDDGNPMFAEIEGASGTWVGGFNENLKNLPSLSNDQVNDSLDIVQPLKDLQINSFSSSEEVSEEEDNAVYPPLDDDDVAPLDYQMAQAIDHSTNEDLLKDVHFISPHTHHAPEDETPLDINDPDFNEKLHQKYFPNLPKDIDKLKWMTPVDSEPINAVIDSVADIRFDFNGDLVPPTREIDSTTISGLHHHSQNPQLAGYTLLELDHLSRSTYPSQRSIAIQTLGRILYKLGQKTYYQLIPEIDSQTYKEDGSIENVMNKIYSMFWDMLKEMGTIEWLEFTSIEKNTRNISVRNYAIDALWLWKQGGGDFRIEKKHK